MYDIDLLEKRLRKLELRMGDLLTREGPKYLSTLQVGNSLTYGDGTNYRYFYILGGAGYARGILIRTGASLNRWGIITSSATESGSNYGSDFRIKRYADNGDSIDDPLIIWRDSGAALFANNLRTQGNMTVDGDQNIDGYIIVGDGAAEAIIQANGATGYVRDVRYATNSSLRWILRTTSDTESGGNVGSNFQILRRADDGSAIDAPILIYRSTGIIKIAKDIYTDDYQSWESSSTIVGWSSYTTKKISYKRIGNLVFVKFYIYGTSNSTTTSFTLPYSQTTDGFSLIFMFSAQDNGGALDVGRASLPSNSNTVAFYPSPGGSAWTASGQKQIRGEFIYEAQ